jgi:hypothetical protein
MVVGWVAVEKKDIDGESKLFLDGFSSSHKTNVMGRIFLNALEIFRNRDGEMFVFEGFCLSACLRGDSDCTSLR